MRIVIYLVLCLELGEVEGRISYAMHDKIIMKREGKKKDETYERDHRGKTVRKEGRKERLKPYALVYNAQRCCSFAGHVECVLNQLVSQQIRYWGG